MAPQKLITIPAEKVYLSAQTPRKHESNSRLASAFSSVLPAVLIAAMLPLLCAIGLTEAALVFALVVAIVVAAALGTTSIFAPDRRYAGFAALALSIVAALLMLAIPAVREGFFSLYNGIVFQYDEAYGAYLSLASSGALVTDSALFAALLGILCGTSGWAVTRLRTTGITLLLVVLLCGLCLRINCGLGFAGTVLGLCGWLSQCRLAQLRGSSYPLLYVAAGALLSIAVCAAFFAVCSAAYSPNGTVHNAYSAVTNTADQVRYGSDSLPEGDLAQAPSMNEDEGNSITLTVNGSVSDNLLLHGFTGATYENGTWKPLSHTAYEGEWKGIMSWLEKQGFIPAEQRAEYNSESAAQGTATPDSATISVDTSNADSKYLYTPYTLSSLDGAGSFRLDGAPQSGFVGARTYRFTMDDVPQSDVFTDTNRLASNDSSYSNAENVYSAFVDANYLQVSEEEKEAVNNLIFNENTWDASVTTSDYAVISRVRTMLDTLASYTENPSTPASGEPFTRWFLGEARSGNSAYFATVATFALRSQGIPTRYVEGYRAESSDLANANNTGEALTLNAHDAHAWVEVYLNGAGWTPVEVTPGFYSQSLEADKIIDVSEARSNGSGEITQSESVMGQTEEDTSQDQPSAIERALQAATGVASFLLALALLAILVVVQRKVRIVVRNRAIANEDQAVSVPALYHYLAKVMSEAGIHFDQTRPLDCLGSFKNAFPAIDAEEYHRVVTLHQAFAFGEHELKPNEMRTLRRFTTRIHESLPEPGTLPKRFKRWAIKAL